MTDWLADLPLKTRLCVGPEGSLDVGRPSPEWASFMVFLGWWLAETQVIRGTIHCVAIVPTRACCPPLIALGTLLSSASRPGEDLSWEAFSALPPGTRVHFRVPRPNDRNESHSGILSRSEFRGLPLAIKVDSVPGPNQDHHLTRQVLGPSNFSKYRCRLTPYPTSQRMGRLDRTGAFLGRLVRGFDSRWLLSATSCCTVVTSIAGWRKDTENLVVARTSADKLPLGALLMARSDNSEELTRVFLVPPGDLAARSERLPLVVLDGPRSFRSLQSLPALKVVTLLEHSEYDATVAGDLAGLTSQRDDNLLRSIWVFRQSPPAGIDVLLFAQPPDDLL